MNIVHMPICPTGASLVALSVGVATAFVLLVAVAAVLSSGVRVKLNWGVAVATALLVVLGSVNSKSAVSGGRQLWSLQLINSTLALIVCKGCVSLMCCVKVARL